MGKSGNPAKRAAAQRPAPQRANADVSVDLDKGLVLFLLNGQPIGFHPDTADMLAQSLANASAHVRAHLGVDNRPHSRACGMKCGPGHGPHCAKDCPTCHGGLVTAP